MGCYVIAEAGVNHNGSDKMALQLVDIAADAGADAVKFQTFRADALVTKEARAAEYQRANAGAENQYQMLKQLEMSEELHHKLLQRCRERGIDFLSTPFDFESAQLLDRLGMARIKVPSGELTNLPFIRQLAKFGKPMILSTGMGTLAEVEEAIQAIAAEREINQLSEPLGEMLTILHCTSNYPAQPENVNLKAMQAMTDAFQIPVGYSDHTDGILVSQAAVAMGAQVIEKHFTLDRGLPGPDHKASLEPAELAQMIAQIRIVEKCLGNGVKAPTESELPIRDLVRRSVALANDLVDGEVIQASDLVLLRPGTGIAPKEMTQVIGRKLKHARTAGNVLSWEDFE